MVKYFDYYGPGRRQDNDNSVLTSYDGSEVHESKYGLDVVLNEGKQRRNSALLHLKTNKGHLPKVSASLLPSSIYTKSNKKK